MIMRLTVRQFRITASLWYFNIKTNQHEKKENSEQRNESKDINLSVIPNNYQKTQHLKQAAI